MNESFSPYVFIGARHPRDICTFYFLLSARGKGNIVKFGTYHRHKSIKLNGSKIIRLHFDERVLLSQDVDRLYMVQRDDGAFYQADEYVLTDKHFRLAGRNEH